MAYSSDFIQNSYMRIPNEFYSERFSDILKNSYNFIQVLHQISFQHVFDLKKNENETSTAHD